MPGKRKYIFCDVMAGGRFVKTLRYPYCGLFRLDMDALSAYVREKLPTLKNRNDVQIIVDDI